MEDMEKVENVSPLTTTTTTITPTTTNSPSDVISPSSSAPSSFPAHVPTPSPPPPPLSETSDSEIKPINTTILSSNVTPPPVSEKYPKVNGGHHIHDRLAVDDDDHQSFLDCEESCASTTSSSSSRNLIIDHPDDSQEEDANNTAMEKSNKKRLLPIGKPRDGKVNKKEKENIEEVIGSSIKRKLSIENDENSDSRFVQNQKIVRLEDTNKLEHKFENKLNEIQTDALDGNLMEAAAALKTTNCSILQEMDESNVLKSEIDNSNLDSAVILTQESDKQENISINLTEDTSKSTPNENKAGEHFQEYAQYLGLKPSIKYKCFKCLNSSYDTLVELRDHQKHCLFKKIHSHSKDRSNSTNLSDEQISRDSSSAQQQLTSYNHHQTIETESIKETNHNRFEFDSSSTIHPLSSTTNLPQIHQKHIFLCSACGTYYEQWNLFLHMREIHKRHACLYCFGMFTTAERLTLHLEMKHDLEQNHFDTQEKLLRSSQETCYLMCCICEHMFTEHEHFSDHNCNELIRPCSLCNGQKGKHSANCKLSPTLKSSATTKQKKQRLKRKSKAEMKKDNNNSTLLSILSGVNNQKNHTEIHLNNIGFSVSAVELAQINNNKNINCDTFKGSKQQQQQHIKLNGCVTDPALTTMQAKTSFPSAPPSVPFHQIAPVPVPTFLGPHFVASHSTTTTNQPQQHSVDSFQHYHPHEFPTPNSMEREPNLLNTVNGNNNQLLISDSLNNQNNNTISTRLTSDSDRMHMDAMQNPSFYANALNSVIEGGQRDSCTMNTVSESMTNKLMSDQNLPEQLFNDTTTVNASEVSETKEENDGEKRLLVPKFKLKIPKNYQLTAAIESEPSTTSESDNEDDDDNDNDAGDAEDEDHGKESEDEREDDEQQPASTDFPNEKLPHSEMQHEATNVAEKTLIKETIENLDDEKQQFADHHFKMETQQQEKMDIENLSENFNETQPKHENPMNITETGTKFTSSSLSVSSAIKEEPNKPKPEDGIEIADENIPIIEVLLSQPLDKISMLEFLRICLRATFPFCLYCNHARRIAVNGKSFVLHLIGQHRFTATVDSITAEELLPSTIVVKLKSYLPELTEYYFNLETYCNLNKENLITSYEKIFECFQCRFETRIHKELYLHNRKMHLKTAILCYMCKSNFFNYNEILCHMCPGEPNKYVIFDIQFRCCLCDLDKIPSAFRLMVHLRKAHYACDVCLEDCQSQSKLSSHVWKHKLHHLCYRCGIAYRNKSDITKHLFWKHGTESVLCKRCLQKRWPHVYHFCIPPSSFICEICSLTFSRAMYLKVHKRLHTGDAPYPCTEDNCDQKFISRKLLLKHVAKHVEEHNEQQKMLSAAKSPEKIENAETTATKDEIATETNKTQKGDDRDDADEKKKPKRSDTTTENEPPLPKDGEAGTGGDSAVGDKDGETVVSKREKKKKKSKKESTNKTSLEDDIMNLPAPNLSESDSSDDDEHKEKTDLNSPAPQTLHQLSSPSSPVIDVPKVMLSPPSDAGDEDDDKDVAVNHAPVMDIWENFKAYQASQKANKSKEESDDDNDKVDGNLVSFITPILHVSQSDHDYCLMYYKSILDKEENKKKKEETKENNEKLNNETVTAAIAVASASGDDVNPLKDDETKKRVKSESEKIASDSSSTPSPKKKQKQQQQQRRRSRSKSESSSGGSSSSSSSSCSCGSNCSCSSSSGSSDSSGSSSEDSDSSTSEGRRRIAAKRAAKEEKRKRNKSENSSKANSSDVVDVVTTDPPLETRNLESFIQETDLETDESDTDEDFYDEHPQKLATQLLAEKRKQLMMQTCLSPSHNFDIVENSRPSTPSLPEEVMKEKKVKMKKKKRERKTPKHNPIIAAVPPFNLNIPNLQQQNNVQQIPYETIPPISSDIMPPATLFGPPSTPVNMSPSISNLTPFSSPAAVPTTASTPAPITALQNRLSTGSNSDADAPLKRSKRARRPNKFYGYTSDDDAASNSSYVSGPAAFKPIPPPNFTWRKEDLPTPPKSSKSSKSSGGHSRKNSQSSSSAAAAMSPAQSIPLGMPPIPPIIIRPGSLSSPKPPVIEHNVPLVEPLRIPIPPVPVHHIQPPQIYPLNNRESQESDSSDEDRLHIPLTPSSHHHSSGGRKSSSKAGKTHTTSSVGLTPKMPPVFPQPHSSISTPLAPAIPAIFTAPPSVSATPKRERKIPPALLQTPPDFARIQYFRRNNIRYPIRPPVGARPPREGESIYCYCRCPYDEVSEMIACDGEDCLIEWFHFECVGILVPPTGKWFCPECRQLYSSEMSQQSFGDSDGSSGIMGGGGTASSSGTNGNFHNPMMMMST